MAGNKFLMSFFLALTLIILSSDVSQADIVASWGFEDGLQSNIAADTSGYGVDADGMLLGDAKIVNNYQRGLVLNVGEALGGRVYCGDESKLVNSTAMTVTAWIKPDNPGDSSWQLIAGKGESSSWRLFCSNGSIIWVVTDASGDYNWDNMHVTGGTITDGDWHHVAAVYQQGVGLSIYVDGIEAGFKDLSFTSNGYVWSGDGDPVTIGGFNSGNNVFEGEIDNVKIFNNALEQTEILDVMSSEDYAYRPFYGERTYGSNLRFWWKPVSGAVSYNFYFGSNSDSVSNATVDSSEFVANVDTNSIDYGFINRDFQDCYWRFDGLDNSGNVISQGSVKYFTSNYWFKGKRPLDSGDDLRHLFAPYDLAELNYLGINYIENLFNKRTNFVSYTNLNSLNQNADAFHLQYPDDMARFMEGLVFEDMYSPIVRLELIRRVAKGLMSSRVAGSRATYHFKYRNDGKTFIIKDDSSGLDQGRVALYALHDSAEEYLNIGFRANIDGSWNDITDFSYIDTQGSPFNGDLRSPAGWNESPYRLKREYTNGSDKKVNLTGSYWLSNDDKPVEFAFESADSDLLEIVVGTPGVPMKLLGSGSETGYLYLPDRTTVYNSSTSNRTFNSPDFNYLILRKATSWVGTGYSNALLIIWEGQPDSVGAFSENGYGQIKISYPNSGSTAEGKVWLYPFTFVSHNDMDYLYSMAESFLDKGVLSQKGFPSTYAYNNIPAGLAAAAYILTKYNDPLATSVRVQAENSVDYLLTEESNNMKLSRSFNVIRALAWLVKLGNLGDTRLVTKYTPYLQTKMSSLLSNEFSYDGNGWLNGWNHFYATRATWMAYDATGQQEYLNAYNRAMTVYDIDDNGIYRDGVPLEAPGGFETYAGSLPLGAWGHAGRLTDVNTLINLDVPNGWINPEIPVKDLWNDAGAGPWAQDDANPEYVGYSLGGVNIPQEKKYIVPFGSYPIYDVEGNVILSGEPLLDNPFVPDSTSDEVEVLYDGDIDISYKHDEIQLIPGSDLENSHIIQDSGVIVDNQRSLSGTDDSLIYKFDITGYNGAAIDMAISGRSYTVEVSPDGNRWYERLNTWSPWPKWESIDISFLAGNTDELLNLLVVSPPDDTSLIVDQSDTVIEREHCRYIQNNGYFVYRLDLPLIIQCNLELLVANDYVVEFSKDGINWTKELSAKKHRENGHSVAADAGWLRMVDITKYINSNNQVYMRFSDGGNKILYSGKGAFLRKLTAYGIYDTNEVYVKLSNAPYSKKEGFTLQQFKFRKYHTDILPKNAPFNFDDLALLAFDWLEQVVYNENDGQVVIEAENYAEKNIGGDIFWKDVSDDLSMGLGYVKALPDDGLVIDGVNSPQLRYAVNFNSTGNYYLWIKARGENNEATSLHYGIDGQMVSLQSQYMISQVSRDFQWSSQNSDGSQPFIKIESAGQHMIDLWMREDGIQVDRLLLAKDSAYTPVVDEPVESYYNPTIFEANHNKDSIVDLFDLAIMANYWFNM